MSALGWILVLTLVTASVVVSPWFLLGLVGLLILGALVEGFGW